MGIHRQKINFDLNFTPYTKCNTKLMTNMLNMTKMTNYKTFRKIIGEKSSGLRMKLKVLRLDIKSRIH